MSTTTSRWESYSDALKLSELELQALVDSRARASGTGVQASGSQAGAELRAARRIRVTGGMWIPAELRETGGGVTRLRVYPINLSMKGACVIADRFVHTGVVCVITLQVAEGEAVAVQGKIARCEMVQGRAHELGIEFDAGFDLGLILSDIASSAIAVESGDAKSGCGATGAHEAESKRRTAMARSVREIAEKVGGLAREASNLHAIAQEIGAA